MLGVQWERKWERKARACMSTAGFLVQGEIRITLPKNSNKQTNKKSASKIRQFLLGTVGISVCSICILEKMQGKTGGRTSCEGSPESKLSLPASPPAPPQLISELKWRKSFSWKAHALPWVVETWVCDTASPYRPFFGIQGLATQHSWGQQCFQVVITPRPVGLFAQLVDALPPTADGNMQPGQSPWVGATCAPAVAATAASTSIFSWLFFRFPHSGGGVAEMQKVHPRIVFVSVHTLLPPAIGSPPTPPK